MDVNEALTTSYCQEKEMRIPARAPICCHQQTKVFSQANGLAEKCSSSQFSLCAEEFELSIGSSDDYKTLSLKMYFDLRPPNCINLLLFWEELSQFLETAGIQWGCFSTCVLMEAQAGRTRNAPVKGQKFSRFLFYMCEIYISDFIPFTLTHFCLVSSRNRCGLSSNSV